MPGLRTWIFGIEITFLGGDQRAAAVDLDAAAFEDDRRVEEPLAEAPGRGLGHAAVLLPVGVLGPGVEVEMHDGGFERAGPIDRRTKSGPLSRVQPRLVGWTMKSTARYVRAGALQVARGALGLRFRSDQHADRFAGARSCGRSRCRPSGWCRACRASRWDGAARPARWPRASPIRRASKNRARLASAIGHMSRGYQRGIVHGKAGKIVGNPNHGQKANLSPVARPLSQRPVRNAGMVEEESLPQPGEVPLRQAHSAEEPDRPGEARRPHRQRLPGVQRRAPAGSLPALHREDAAAGRHHRHELLGRPDAGRPGLLLHRSAHQGGVRGLDRRPPARFSTTTCTSR